MRLHSFVASLAILATAMANTKYVTRFHYVTVDGSGKVLGSDVSVPSAVSQPSVIYLDDEESSQVAAGPSTTEIKVTAETSAPAKADTKSSSGSDSGSDSSDSSSSSGGDSFAQSMLAIHNKLRAAHSSPPLTWSDDVYAFAKSYADKYTCGSGLVHSGGQYGENLALGYSDGVAAVKAWYSEGDNYDYSSASVLDHFTQVIWKSTTKLGCAYKDCGGGQYIICSYDPAGNFVGQGKSNLFPN